MKEVNPDKLSLFARVCRQSMRQSLSTEGVRVHQVERIKRQPKNLYKLPV